MDATNNNNTNDLTTFNPFENVDKKTYNLVYHHRVTDLTFAEFLEREKFEVNLFAIPIKFWLSLNQLKKDEWFTLTDEIIDLIGYKSCASNASVGRSNMLRFMRKNFEEGTDFFANRERCTKTGSGGHNKFEIRMKKYPFKRMLLKVGTQISDLIHDYLIKLEEVTIKYMNYQYHCQIVATNRANAILEEKEEELSKYTYEPVDDSLSRIIAYRPDTIFPAMSTLSPRSKKARRQMLQNEDKQNYFCVFKAKQHLKEYGLDSSSSDTDSNNDCESDHDSFA